MLEWLKNKLAGDELRRKEEAIQHYRELLRAYEVRHDELTRAKLKAEILEMHIEQGVNLDDAIKRAVSMSAPVLNPQLHNQMMAAQQNMNSYGQNCMRGASSISGIFGSAFFQ